MMPGRSQLAPDAAQHTPHVTQLDDIIAAMSASAPRSASPLLRVQAPLILPPIAHAFLPPASASLTPTAGTRSELFSYAAGVRQAQEEAEVITHTVRQMRAEVNEPLLTEPADEVKSSTPDVVLKELDTPASKPERSLAAFEESCPPQEIATPVPVSTPAWARQRVSHLEVLPLLAVLVGCYTLACPVP